MNNKLKTTFDALPAIARYIMVLLVLTFISFLFPNNVRFKYQFEEGQSWRYKDLTAPFDFAILKPLQEIEEERKAIEKEFSPYYELKTEVAIAERKAFEEAFTEQIEMVEGEEAFVDVLAKPSHYLDYGNSFLQRVYDQGVIQFTEADVNKDKDFVVNVVQGNTTKPRTIQHLFTVSSAINLLSDTLPYSNLEEPSFLLPILATHLKANIFYNDTLTQQFEKEALEAVSTVRGLVRKGELIVPQNGIVTADIYQKLISFRQQYEQEITEQKSFLGVFLGYLIVAGLIFIIFMAYLAMYGKEVFNSFIKLTFIFLWLVAYSYLVYAVELGNVLSIYLIPFCIVPIVIKNFYSDRVAIFTHIVVIMLACFLASQGLDFAFIQIFAGIVAVLSNSDTRDWTRFFYSMVFIFFTYAIAFLGLQLIQEGVIQKIDYKVYNWLFLNVFLTLLAYPLIPLLERLFGFTSTISLVELLDLNRPLLRELSNKAPGTLQHSLQVGNLAEAAANEIGANALMCKVGALYHDIGKTVKPNFFIENQQGQSPHDKISDLESAQIIIGHVSEGVELAKKYRLPKVIIDFIQTHHGTTRVEYFYQNYLKKHPEEEVDESLFTYSGPKPRTKEESILMFADSIEAACKSLKEPTDQKIGNLIDKVISSKLQKQQLSDSEMTFEELERCKAIFKMMMKNIHHVRIEYPEEQS